MLDEIKSKCVGQSKPNARGNQKKYRGDQKQMLDMIKNECPRRSNMNAPGSQTRMHKEIQNEQMPEGIKTNARGLIPVIQNLFHNFPKPYFLKPLTRTYYPKLYFYHLGQTCPNSSKCQNQLRKDPKFPTFLNFLNSIKPARPPKT